MPTVVRIDIMVHRTMMTVIIRSGRTFRQLALSALPLWVPTNPLKDWSLATEELASRLLLTLAPTREKPTSGGLESGKKNRSPAPRPRRAASQTASAFLIPYKIIPTPFCQRQVGISRYFSSLPSRNLDPEPSPVVSHPSAPSQAVYCSHST